ncbi:hypothetical protein SSPIM334S_03899 [Streptomyces spiroverticillatus]
MNSTGSAEPTVSSRDLPPPFSEVTLSTAKSYGAPSPPVGPPWEIHWAEVSALLAHHTPYGAICSRVVSPETRRAWSLYEGTKATLRYQPPLAPACTQWPAVHTRLDLPGCAGSFTTVAEQDIDPSGPSNSNRPDSGAAEWYGALAAFAGRRAGIGSVTPLSPEMSLSTGFCGCLSASFMRSGFHRPAMIGLTKSSASRSQSSLFQFFQSPFFHLSRSIPCSLSRSLRSSGILILSSPEPPVVAAEPVAGAVGVPAAPSSVGPQAVTVRASAATSPAADIKGALPRRALLPWRTVRVGRMGRIS